MSADTTYILVTGANAGLGFAICCRLIDEFLATRHESESLHLIPTTRSQAKADDTVKRLNKHLAKVCYLANANLPGATKVLESRVVIEPELLDLCNILSVQRASKRLRQKYERLDAVILNAGIGGWIGIDLWKATKQFFREGIYLVWRPEFKICDVGATAPLQLPEEKVEKGVESKADVGDARKEPQLASVFTANVFGHYLLVHYLMPLLSRSTGQESSRVIWVSSAEAYAKDFFLEDIQGFKSTVAYESSKRLTDVLAFTASAPSSKPYTTSYFSSSGATGASSLQSSGILDEELTPRKASLRASTRARASTPNGRSSRTSSPRPGAATSPSSNPPIVFSTHPGMCVTDIITLNIFFYYAWIGIFYIARWLGSPWHNTWPYSGATAMTYLALAPREQLEAFAREGDVNDVKWGSSTNWKGDERVRRAEVEGLVSEKGKNEKEEVRQDFFALGRDVWKGMEELRSEWEARLRDAGLDEGLS